MTQRPQPEAAAAAGAGAAGSRPSLPPARRSITQSCCRLPSAAHRSPAAQVPEAPRAASAAARSAPLPCEGPGWLKLLIGPFEQFTAGDTGPEALFGPSPALPNMGLGGEHVGMARAVQLIGARHQGAITPSAIHTTPLSLCRSRRPAASAAAARADLSHSIHQEAQGPGTCK